MITTSTELEELIDSTVAIPTIPSVLMEINQVMASPDSSTTDATQIIERDPAIAARALRLVNSSFYGLKNSISSISMACSILGLKVIKNLVIQTTVLEQFPGSGDAVGFDTNALWDHSFKTAMAAKLLAQQSSLETQLSPDDAYTAGLIHDVGKMVLLQSQSERFSEALELSKKNGIPLATAEGQLFGFSHAHVGGLLAGRWKLAPTLQAAVMYHHSPGTEAEDWVMGFLIKAANTLSHQVSQTQSWIGDLCDDDTLSTLGLSSEQLECIREEVADVTMV